MYALMESTPYEGEWPIAYFDADYEAAEALQFIYAHDEKTHPDLPRTEWDWGYFVRKIETKTLVEFKSRYDAEEKFWEMIKKLDGKETTLGGDDCYAGRGLWSGESNPNTDIGINVLTNS